MFEPIYFQAMKAVLPVMQVDEVAKEITIRDFMYFHVVPQSELLKKRFISAVTSPSTSLSFYFFLLLSASLLLFAFLWEVSYSLSCIEPILFF
tara:strand:- start:151 stop:429 length:279 start_codon:yes stop_codon:yes gene_type:complete